jgi:hypothetical protein
MDHVLKENALTYASNSLDYEAVLLGKNDKTETLMTRNSRNIAVTRGNE